MVSSMMAKTMLIIMLLLGMSVAEEMVEVFTTKSYLGRDAISGAKLLDNRKDVAISDITFCIRFKYKKPMALIIIEEWKIDDNVDMNTILSLLSLTASYPQSFFGFGYPRKTGFGSYKNWVIRNPDNPDYSWAFNKWCHVCLSYEKKLGLARLVMDGKVTNIHAPDPEFTGVKIPAEFLSMVYLARCNTNLCPNPEGQQISDFNIWSRALTEAEMKDWTACRSMLKGDVVDSSTAKFEIANMTVEKQPMSYLCNPPRPGHVIFPEGRNFSNQQDFCQKMRGVSSVVVGNKTQIALTQELAKYSSVCGTDFWSGWWDIPQEGQFSSIVTEEILVPGMFAPWQLGRPNGDTLENCVGVQGAAQTWNDIYCSTKLCTFCELETYPDLQIRGLCLDSAFDAKYTWTRSMFNNRYNFNGYANSRLFWDVTNEYWKLELYSDPSIYASSSIYEYPLGTNVWKIYGDPCYKLNNVTEVFLNVNACYRSEYNCVNGQCVSMDQRCDGKVDCSDETDEIGCTIFTTYASYLKDVPPAPLKGELQPVRISVEILAILDIKEVENKISLQLQLHLAWLDKRLTMYNLKNDRDINTLTADLRSRIWIPEVIFYNTQNKLESLNDDKAFVTITRNGSFTMNSRDNLQNSYIFKGAENPITISRVYDAEFICQFNMATFPFDTQVCYVILTMKGNTAKFIEMKADELKYLGPVDLTQYFVKNMSMQEQTMSLNVTSVKVDIIFGRRILGTMLTAYLPTILICIVSFSTNYYKSFFFEANVSVNLTCLLVLTTLYISVVTSMTKTSYIKMIDVFFIFNLCIPFAEVLLHTYIDSLREEEGREINHHGKKQPSPKDNNKIGDAKKQEIMSKLNSLHDDEEVNARKDLYETIATANRNQFKIKIAVKIVDTGLPILFILFMAAYFGVGIYYYHYAT